MPYLNENQRIRVATEVELGTLINVVAEEFGKSRSTVKHIARKWRDKRRINTNPGSGRPKVSNSAQDHAPLAVA